MFWRIVKGLFVASVFVGTWIGLAFIPKDLADFGEAIRAWEEFMPVDRETAFIIFSGLCVTYIFWRDFEETVVPLFAYRLGFWKDERMSFPEMASYAEKKLGWKISSGSFDVLDLVDWIGDAASAGRVTVYGRYNPQDMSNARNIYLADIEKRHWLDHELDCYDAIRLGQNIHAASRLRTEPGRPRVYFDLHLNRQQAKRCLRREQTSWRGRNKKNEDERQRRFKESFAIQDELVSPQLPEDTQS